MLGGVFNAKKQKDSHFVFWYLTQTPQIYLKSTTTADPLGYGVFIVLHLVKIQLYFVTRT